MINLVGINAPSVKEIKLKKSLLSLKIPRAQTKKKKQKPFSLHWAILVTPKPWAKVNRVIRYEIKIKKNLYKFFFKNQKILTKIHFEK